MAYSFWFVIIARAEPQNPPKSGKGLNVIGGGRDSKSPAKHSAATAEIDFSIVMNLLFQMF